MGAIGRSQIAGSPRQGAHILQRCPPAGADIIPDYLKAARDRIKLAACGKLRRRPIGRPVYIPRPTDKIAQRPEDWNSDRVQPPLFM